MLVSDLQAQSQTLAAEAELIARAQQQDTNALSILYREHVQAVYRYTLLRVQNANIAEDLTSEIFIKVVEALPRYKHRGRPFGAWVMKIAHDHVVDYYRRQKRRPITTLNDTLPSKDVPVESTTETQETVSKLYEHLAQLSEKQRIVIQYRFIEGWSLAKTAALMKTSINAVKALQHRALRTLNQKMQDHDQET